VSNSSSSSFCIFAINITKNELLEKVFSRISKMVRVCNHLVSDQPFCSYCGKPMWVEEKISTYEAIEKINNSRDCSYRAFDFNHCYYLGWEITDWSLKDFDEIATEVVKLEKEFDGDVIVYSGEYEN
jgi:hypothetical protein